MWKQSLYKVQHVYIQAIPEDLCPSQMTDRTRCDTHVIAPPPTPLQILCSSKAKEVRVWRRLDPQREPSTWHVRGDLLWGGSEAVKVLKRQHQNPGSDAPRSNLTPIRRNPSRTNNKEASPKPLHNTALMIMDVTEETWSAGSLSTPHHHHHHRHHKEDRSIQRGFFLNLHLSDSHSLLPCVFRAPASQQQ